MIDIRDERPINFDGIVGHEKNISMLKNALKFGFPEFTILSGEEGIGKTTLSKILAKNLICPNAFNGVACEDCETCQNVTARLIKGNKDVTNVRTFRMSDEGGKKAARAIITYMGQLPQGSKHKVIILEECQGMTREAQDLLLPALEYIPSNTKIIACTTNPKSLQRTFLSRSNIFAFSIPDKAETVKLLSHIANRAGIKIVGKTTLPRIVEYANSKPRTAVKTLQTLTCQGSEINITTVNDFLNLIDEEYYLDYLDLLRGDMGLVLDFIDTLSSREITLTDFVKGLNNFMLVLITLRYRSVVLPESLIKRSKKLVTSMAEKDLLKIQTILATEAPKVIDEEYAKSQLISLSFKIMSRNDSDLVGTPLQSKEKAQREHEAALKNFVKKSKAQENKDQIKTLDLSNNPNTFLYGLSPTVVRKGTVTTVAPTEESVAPVETEPKEIPVSLEDLLKEAEGTE